LPKIERSIDIHASRARIWELISDPEREADFWHGTKEVRIISRNGNEIDRELTQFFRSHKILQKEILHPESSTVETRYLKGLTEGVRILSIEPLGEDRQRLKAFWNVHFTSIYRLMTPYVRRHIDEGTVNALERIKEEAEKEPLKIEGHPGASTN